MSERAPDVTRLLGRLRDGEDTAFDELFSAVYDQLRRIASNQLNGEREGAVARTTELVHEAYEKLVDHHAVEWADRQHFYAVAARAMRQVLVDHARRRAAEKRGGGQADLRLDAPAPGARAGPLQLVEIDDLLDRLADQHERMAQVVDCRFFAGYTIGETADVLGVSRSTVNRDWSTARAWLNRELSGPPAAGN
jgi:RNA polymerase sigma factor (TIGR02999 family)